MRALLVIIALLIASPALAEALIPLTIETASGAKHHFSVELADDYEERQKGLMFRKELAENGGMLFDFKRTQRVAMWMQNTPLSLDMLFISEEGVVKDLHERAVPFSTTTIQAKRRVRYVLELLGGTANRLAISAGDRVSWGK